MDLQFHSYKLIVVQELSERDYANWYASAKAILQNVSHNVSVLSSDEMYVHLLGCVNRQNFCYWDPTNPKQFHEHPLHSEIVNLWSTVAGFWCNWLWLSEDDGHIVIVTSVLECYITPCSCNWMNVTIWLCWDSNRMMP